MIKARGSIAQQKDNKLQSHLNKIEYLTKTARLIWSANAVSTLYVLIALSAIKDIDFYIPGSLVRLPVVNSDVSASAFLIFAAIILLSGHTFFILTISRLWGEIGELPRKLNGRSRLMEISPWTLNYFLAPLKNRSFAITGFVVALISGWLLIPTMIIIVLVRSLPAHNQYILVFLVLTFSTALVISICSLWNLFRVDIKPKNQNTLYTEIAGLILIAILSGSLFFGLKAFIKRGGEFRLWGAEISSRPFLPKANFDLSLPDNQKNSLRQLGEYLDRYAEENYEIMYQEFIQDSELGLNIRLDKASDSIRKKGGERALEISALKLQFTAPSFWNADMLPTGMKFESFNIEDANCDVRNRNNRSLDLSFAFLRHSSLSNSLFNCSNMRNSDAMNANFVNSNLHSVDLRESVLHQTNFIRSKLINTDFRQSSMLEGSLHISTLISANFENIKFSHGYVSKATGQANNFRNSDVSSVLLVQSDIPETNFEGSRLNFRVAGSNFQTSIWNNAKIDGSTIVASNFSQGQWKDSWLIDSEILASNFQNSVISDALLSNIKIKNSNFHNSRISNSALMDYSITNSKMIGVRFVNVDFLDGNLDNTDFTASYIRKSYISEKDGFSQKQLNQMFGDGSVSLSSKSGLHKPSHWSDNILEESEFEDCWRSWLFAKFPDLADTSIKHSSEKCPDTRYRTNER